MIVTIHHYELADSATEEDFLEAVRKAEDEGLFGLPGLIEYQFLRGIKGTRTNEYAALWTYESREEWRELWGSVEDPVSKGDYPAKWNRWEDELLAPILSGPPDSIDYTSYEVEISGEPCRR